MSLLSPCFRTVQRCIKSLSVAIDSIFITALDQRFCEIAGASLETRHCKCSRMEGSDGMFDS